MKDLYEIETLSDKEIEKRLHKAYSRIHFNAFGSFISLAEFQNMNLIKSEVK